MDFILNLDGTVECLVVLPSKSHHKLFSAVKGWLMESRRTSCSGEIRRLRWWVTMIHDVKDYKLR
jgi:hypothetical protein